VGGIADAARSSRTVTRGRIENILREVCIPVWMYILEIEGEKEGHPGAQAAPVFPAKIRPYRTRGASA